MKTIFSILVLSFLLQTGCATLDEEMYESDAPAYQKTTDKEGHTKYVRERIVPSDAPQYTPLRPIVSALTPTPTPRSTYSIGDSPTRPYASSIKLDGVFDKSDGVRDSGLSLNWVSNFHATNLDLDYEWMGKYFDFDVGLALLDSDHTYLGFTGGARAHLPWKVSPFAGLGLYGGDSKTCSYESMGNGYDTETCEKYFLAALTLDYGVQIKFSDALQARVFARNFSDTEQGDPRAQTLYGLGITFLF
jgi:hypothetical protein